ncbi:beta-trefoil [Lichtheimia hyalospora FSU 10163]|nr:beta-trefoil [Lichtheimia hyalospora FSU 10163]
MTCYHAAVAQKSYGSEKRFLCPPPIVSIEGKSSYPLVSMAVMCENGERILEQKVQLDDDQRGSFRFLHVAGTAKAKQFYLRVSLTHNPTNNAYAISPPPAPPYVSFVSSPVTIISKPSKKTCKARSVSSCIVSSAPVALFNRINSQTVRTKYLATEDDRLCAKNAMWSPFDIIVLRQPPVDEGGSEIMDANAPYGGIPVVYGSEIILRDTQSGVESPPLYIRKVDKGRIIHSAEGPVSQMQKIALQLASSNNNNDQRMYLSAAGPVMNPSSSAQPTTWLEFVSSRVVADKPRQDPSERVDDFVTWTIVGIANNPSHNRTMPQPSPPPSPPPRRIMPLPLVSTVRCYDMNTLELTGQHLLQPSNGRLLDVWLGAYGPLNLKNQIHIDDSSLTLIFQLPSLHDLVAAHHGNVISHSDGTRHFELPLLLMRQDGSTLPSGKSIACSLLPSGLPAYVHVVSRD